MKRSPSTLILFTGFIGVVIGGVAMQPVIESVREQTPPQTTSTIKRLPTAEEIATPHLIRANQECERIIDEHLSAVDLFFLDSKKNTRGFADEALSLGSKWRLIVDYVPFTRGGRHEAFIREKFEKHIFNPEQFEEVVGQAVASYLKHVESIESKMLVDIRTDVADFPTAYIISQMDDSKVRASYEDAIKRALEASGGSLRTDVATEIVSIIAGEVLTQVAVRLGVSAGVLGTGAASTWATFGIGFVVSVIVDQIVTIVWDWYADPRGNLTNELKMKLGQIHRLVVDGSTGVGGLRDRLRQFAKDRSELRETAVLSLLQPQNP